MKIPQIRGSNKIRDAEICRLWGEDCIATDVIGEKYSLTQRRIEQIVRTNMDFVKPNKEWERIKRIRILKQQIKKRGDSKKDMADLVSQLREETEELKDSPTFNINQTTIVQNDRDKLTPEIRERQDRFMGLLRRKFQE